jgi:hypothetical protein
MVVVDGIVACPCSPDAYLAAPGSVVEEAE